MKHELTDEQCALARNLWAAGEPRDGIAAALGISVDTFRARMTDQLRGLPKRPRSVNSGRRGVDPTPDQIAYETATLRASWPEERFLPALPPDCSAF